MGNLNLLITTIKWRLAWRVCAANDSFILYLAHSLPPFPAILFHLLKHTYTHTHNHTCTLSDRGPSLFLAFYSIPTLSSKSKSLCSGQTQLSQFFRKKSKTGVGQLPFLAVRGELSVYRGAHKPDPNLALRHQRSLHGDRDIRTKYPNRTGMN